MSSLLLDEVLNEEIDPAYRRRARIIISNLDLRKGRSVLEVGCGRGYYGKIIGQFFPDCRYMGIDTNKDYLEYANNLVKYRNVKFQYGSAISLPFKNKSFDAIICSEVLEHLQDDEKALKEMHRILKQGGAVMITVPNKNYPFFWDPLNWMLERLFNYHIPSNIWWLAGIWADHIRLYTEGELLSKIQSSKFKVLELWRSTHFCMPFIHFLLYGIGKNIVEKGFLSSFNRFSTKKSSSLKEFALKVINFFDTRNEYNLSEGDAYLNIIVKMKK